MIRIYFWDGRNGLRGAKEQLIEKLKQIAEDRGDHFVYHNGSLDGFAKDYGDKFLVEPSGRDGLIVWITPFARFFEDRFVGR